MAEDRRVVLAGGVEAEDDAGIAVEVVDLTSARRRPGRVDRDDTAGQREVLGEAGPTISPVTELKMGWI